LLSSSFCLFLNVLLCLASLGFLFGLLCFAFPFLLWLFQNHHFTLLFEYLKLFLTPLYSLLNSSLFFPSQNRYNSTSGDTNKPSALAKVMEELNAHSVEASLNDRSSSPVHTVKLKKGQKEPEHSAYRASYYKRLQAKMMGKKVRETSEKGKSGVEMMINNLR
jgi:hypothetical protein